MHNFLPRFTLGLHRTAGPTPLRNAIVSAMQKLFPEFDLPYSVDVNLENLSDELFKFSLQLPATYLPPGEKPDYAFDLYESFAYLFGKGFYNASEAGGEESMVWYVTKEQWQVLATDAPALADVVKFD